MRCYLIEDLTREQGKAIAEALASRGFAQPIDGLFWIPVSEELYTDIQREHCEECGPYVLGLEIVDEPEGCSLKMELLARAKGRLRCACVAYASPEQRDNAINFLDDFIRELDIPV